MRKLVNYKNPILRTKSVKVNKDEDLTDLLKDMDKIGTVFHAYGISAVQLGVAKCVFLFRESSLDQFKVAINPVIKEISESGSTALEGCLSFPNVSMPISRPFMCKVEFTTQSGELVEDTYTGMLARVFMHEFSHLQGETIIDGISNMKLYMVEKKIKKWQKKVDSNGAIYEIR